MCVANFTKDPLLPPLAGAVESRVDLPAVIRLNPHSPVYGCDATASRFSRNPFGLQGDNSSSNNTPEPKPSTSKLNVNRDKKSTADQPPQPEPSKPNVTVIADHNPSPKATVDRFAGGAKNSKKGKAVKPATPEDSDNGDNDKSDDEVNDEDEENCEEEERTEIAKPKRGCPCKDILKEAAKQMKKY
ncbi:hypothetical protein PtA15_4A665 [Puccinia triticina]|uniref:Uncharacterized protein n=1 Tax=Puccinia triticina TaxID=208348 RepID=A0ABY7CH23_9BASI|nr:uncharacterized protein PtA15_4A665 [Puccinia triticina]WAQ84213.1 hypothetical protein PtA15_4A665 [Puccinia triticina]